MEDDSEKRIEECKDSECRDHPVLLYKGLSDQGTAGSSNEEVENEEIVMTTLNGLPRTWESFIQGICAIKKLVKFNILWEECSQEESHIAA